LAKSKYGEFDTKDDVLEHIAYLWELYEGEGLEEAYKAFMELPIEERTSTKLDRICKGIAPADIDPYDYIDFMTRI
jgi:hypothetical protein